MARTFLCVHTPPVSRNSQLHGGVYFSLSPHAERPLDHERGEKVNKP